MSSQKSLIHIKLEYPEALEGKKDLLRSKLSLVKIQKAIKKYNALRLLELKTKIKLYKKIKTTNTIIKRLQTSLPKTEGSADFKKIKRDFKEPKTLDKKYDRETEMELRKIQEKLNSLQ